MADVAARTKVPGRSTMMITVAALTLLAALGGGLVGKVIAAKLKPASPAGEKAPSGPLPPASGAHAEQLEMRELAPIIANLAAPADVRARLQVAIVFPKKAVEMPSLLSAQIADDFLAYVKTLTLGELQGASGLQALREDLNDRAKARSDGKVREVMIENFVVQ